MRSVGLVICLFLALASPGLSTAEDVVATTVETARPSAPETHEAVSTHVRPGDRVYIEQSVFGMALAAAILKKEVPVSVTSDSTKAEFYIHTTSQESHEGGAERVAKILSFGGFAGSGEHYKASTTVTNRDGDVVFAYNSNKGNFQATAQNAAKNFKKYVEENSGDK